MTDVYTWDAVDSQNNEPPPAGAPEGQMQARDYNDVMRAIFGASKRWLIDIEGRNVSTGTEPAYVVGTSQSFASYYDGLTTAFRAHENNTGPPTLDVDGVGPVGLVSVVGDPLPVDAIVADVVYTATYFLSSNHFRLRADPPLDAVAPVTFLPGMKMTYFGTTLAGWLMLNGDTIGSTASAAAQNDDDNEALFTHLWDSLADAQAPVSTGRGASGAADFAADKTLTLVDARGRSVMGAGQGAGLIDRIVGDVGGDEDATALLAHTHDGSGMSAASDGAHVHRQRGFVDGSGSFVNNFGTTAQNIADSTVDTSSTGAHTHTISGLTGSTDAGDPVDSNLGPWFASNWFIKV